MLISLYNIHMNNDNWANDACWRVEYFECENCSEAEAFESHLIALYETWRYYNKAKCDWGENRWHEPGDQQLILI